MDSQKRGLITLAIIGLAFSIFVFRLPLARRAAEKLYLTIDDLELTETAADRFLGVPHTQDHWPGTTNHLLFCPLIAVDYLLTSRTTQLSPGSFVDYLSHFYRNPWRFFLVALIAGAVVNSIGLALLLPNIAQCTGTLFGTWVGLLLVATVPGLMVGGAAFGSGTALGLASIAISISLLPPARSRFEAWVTPIAGAAFGLALASRNTVAPLALFIAALLAGRSGRPLRATIGFFVAAGFAFLFACPQTWVEPIRWAKANLGNYVKHGSPIGFAHALSFFVEVIPLWLIGASLAALLRLIMKRSWHIVVGSIAAFLVMTLLAARAPTVFPRYFYPMILLAGVVSCIGLIPWLATVVADENARGRFWRSLFVAMVILLILGTNIFETHKLLQTTFQSRGETTFANGSEAESVRDAIRAYAHKKILVPLVLLPWVTDLASADSLKAACRGAESVLRGDDSIADFTASFGLDAKYTSALADNFTEKQQAFAARFRIMAAGIGHGDVDITFYASPDDAKRYGLITDGEALDGLGQRRFDAMIVDLQRKQLIKEPVYVITPTLWMATPRESPR